MQKETGTEKEKYRRDESKRNYVRNYSTKLPSKCTSCLTRSAGRHPMLAAPDVFMHPAF